MAKKKKNENKKSFLQIGVAKTSKSKIKLNGTMKSNVIPPHPFRGIISGSSGSGKTNLLLDLLTCSSKYHGYYDLCFVISPTAGKTDDAYKLLMDKMKKSKTKLFIINRPTAEQVEHIMTLNKEIIEEQGLVKAPKILIIYDDIISDKKFMNTKAFLHSFVASRHYNASVVICTQKFNAVPRTCRIQASAVFYFRGTQGEDARLVEEFCPPKYNKKEFTNLLDYATRKPYSFLFINTHVGFRERFRECLHTILTLDRFEEQEKNDDNPQGITDDDDDEGDEEDEGDEGDDTDKENEK